MDNNKNHLLIILITFLSLIVIIFSDLFAGTSGKIAGRVIDKTTKEPLAGVNVIISNTMLGASTDENGEFFILNIAPGVYEVQFLYVGYTANIIKNVNVQVDLTTLLDIEIEQQALEGETIVITAVRPVIQKDATATATVISARDFKEVPVENFKAIVQTKAGVTKDKDGNLHIRGSRSNEILYIIDGVPVNNAFDNQVSLNVSTNAIEELSVIIGAFNAEYGKAMSGIINIVTKEGTKEFTGNVSFQTGDMLSGSQDIFMNIQTYDPLNAYEIEGNLSGYFPFLLKDKLSFSTSCRYYKDDGYLYGVREYKATTKEPGEEAQLIKGDSA
ncbi:MAG: TonB-dependent receptor, partial [Methanosarcinaceae archaeon]